MADQRDEPNANEMKFTTPSEYARHPNSPAATGAGQPAAEQPSKPEDVTPSEEAKRQWVGAKGPAESGKP